MSVPTSPEELRALPVQEQLDWLGKVFCSFALPLKYHNVCTLARSSLRVDRGLTPSMARAVHRLFRYLPETPVEGAESPVVASKPSKGTKPTSVSKKALQRAVERLKANDEGSINLSRSERTRMEKIIARSEEK